MNKKPVAAIILSIISIVSALVAIIFGILFVRTIMFDAGTSGDYITNEVLVFAFEFFMFLCLSLGVAVEGFVTGLIGMILTIKKKFVKLIWLPILGMLGCFSSFVIVSFAFSIISASAD